MSLGSSRNLGNRSRRKWTTVVGEQTCLWWCHVSFLLLLFILVCALFKTKSFPLCYEHFSFFFFLNSVTNSSFFYFWRCCQEEHFLNRVIFFQSFAFLFYLLCHWAQLQKEHSLLLLSSILEILSLSCQIGHKCQVQICCLANKTSVLVQTLKSWFYLNFLNLS